jgi:hypothetical protein
MSNDAAEFHKHLRVSTAKLLGYGGVDDLTAAQEIRVDRAITLRLVIDDAQAKQMCGSAIDVRQFTAASEDLERMCGGNPETSTTHKFAGARQELAALFEKRAEALARRDLRIEAEMAMDPNKFRRELEEKLACAIAKHGKTIPDPAKGIGISYTDPASSAAQSDLGVAHPPPSPAAPTGGGWAPPAAPPPRRVETDLERHERINAAPVPPGYLKQEDELPWRDYIDADGNIASPWFRPHG